MIYEISSVIYELGCFLDATVTRFASYARLICSPSWPWFCCIPQMGRPFTSTTKQPAPHFTARVPSFTAWCQNVICSLVQHGRVFDPRGPKCRFRLARRPTL